jgi:hypothetical protein
MAAGVAPLGVNWGQSTQSGLNASSLRPPMNSEFSGRWDRNRTCNLRFWSTRRAVQTRPGKSKLRLNSRFLATHRPASSKNVQPVCSQFCSQLEPYLHSETGIS